MASLLEVADLHIAFGAGETALTPVRGLTFTVAAGETVCLVGESGCGKSLTSLAIMGLLPPRARLTAERIGFEGIDLARAASRQLADLRGNRLAMIFQEPMTSLNPCFTVGDQLEEAYLRHRGGGRAAARARALHLLQRCGITAAAERLRQYPHQLSGGLRQRVMIAMALMCEPALLIADEPTTALDVTIQAQILHLLISLQRELGMGLLLITHDLGIVSRVADRVAVMYAGRIVETGSAAEVFRAPHHPYTTGLIRSLPEAGEGQARLGTIPGIVPTLRAGFAGCAFRNRCDHAVPACAAEPVPERRAGATHRFACTAPHLGAMGAPA